jgi:Cd2+/Zn2+-exporting ATPase/Cu+-exporting ATPase
VEQEPDSRSQQGGGEQEQRGQLGIADLARIAFVLLAVLAVWLRLWEPFPRFSLIAWTAMLVGGFPIFMEAAENILERHMTMELSMSIAIVAALAIGESVTALIILLFVQVAEVLEGLTVGRGRRAIKNLLELLPHNATVRRDGALVEIQIDEIRCGDFVVVKPGERVPVDGVIVSGHSAVDQSAITGESLPVDRSVGARAYAGTINLSGSIEVRVEGVGCDTAFGKIVEAVERAEKSRAPIQKTADRFAGYLVYFAMGCAAITYVLTRNIRSTISVVIVAGACGIAAGTPLAILGAIGQAARKGAIIKGGIYLESLGTVDTVVLDKTGTLTFGRPEVIAVQAADGSLPEAILSAAATAERLSEHPTGAAVLRKATAMSLPVPEPEEFEYMPGRGIVARFQGEDIIVGSRMFLEQHQVPLKTFPRGNNSNGSEVFVARHGLFLGSLTLADTLRPEAKLAIEALRGMGMRTLLLTGDVGPVAAAVGRALGVDAVEPELLPEQKMHRVRTLMSEGKKVAMVGDGINDAPALAAATVGVAMGSGTDVARESADVVLLGNDLLKFAETIGIARKCRRVILTNFAGTLLVDTVGVGLAAFGFLNPLLAAFIHVSSELVFILNSARLLPRVRSS